MTESITLAQLWTVAAVLAGFQVTAFSWRINRELYMEERDNADKGQEFTSVREADGKRKSEPTWVTFADGFVAISFLLLIFGVFAAPLFGTTTTDLATRLFGFALVLFGSSALVLAGHYNLYCELGVKYHANGKRCRRGRVTTQEILAVVAAIILLGIYGVWWALTT